MMKYMGNETDFRQYLLSSASGCVAFFQIENTSNVPKLYGS